MMEKYFNEFSLAVAMVGGMVCKFLGGWDMLLNAIVILVVLDYITGVLKSIYNKQLSSDIGFKGLVKKISIFVVIATSCVIQKILGDIVPLREITILFFIANEGISILENVGQFVPIPKKLKDVLIQLREKEEGE